jgi:hypothetical protein
MSKTVRANDAYMVCKDANQSKLAASMTNIPRNYQDGEP